MPKAYKEQNVLDAARERIAYTFDHFERVYVSYSAGKDSTVLLHLVMDEAIKRDRRVGMLLIDLEGQYKLTMDHAATCYDMYADHIDRYWLCLPMALRNAVSVYEPKWMCWEPGKEEAWIRPLPDNVISDPEFFPFFTPGMEFEEFVPEFGEWYAQGQSCACMVGIRSDESLNRYRTIASRYKETFNGKQWTSRITPNTVNVYPIYDWRTEDIWTYHARFPDRPYNHLYDLMMQAGLKLSQQRICQPYGDDQRRGLWLFHIIEPETWARVVARVNGANSGATYIQEWGSINGYRKITKPSHHTWASFAQLLMDSMPPETAENYQNRILLFQKWWMARGYPDGIPDEAPYELEAKHKAPSWRRVCKTLLRNDHFSKGLGFSQPKSHAYGKYLELMRKRKEQWAIGQDALQFTAPVEPVEPEVLEKLQSQLANR